MAISKFTFETAGKANADRRAAGPDGQSSVKLLALLRNITSSFSLQPMHCKSNNVGGHAFNRAL